MRLFDFFRNFGERQPAQGAQEQAPETNGERSVFLHYREGNSDKVYHVVLLQEPDGNYTVSFEYGRRGTQLQTGTKTPDPVSLEAAQKIFDKLVSEKTQKGYQPYSPDEAPAPKSRRRNNPAARNKAIIAHLSLAARSPEAQEEKNWRLSRVVWRAGVLQLPDALPHLAKLLVQLPGEEPEMLQYCLLWAIFRCSQHADVTQKSAALPVVKTLMARQFNPMTAMVFHALSNTDERIFLRNQLITKLPPSCQNNLEQQQSETLLQTLRDYVINRPKSHFEFVEYLYALNEPTARPAILWFAQEAPFAPGFFKVHRHLFKLAEMSFDAEMFGVYNIRFTTEKARFVSKNEPTWMEVNGKWQEFDMKADLAKPDTQFAFSNKTRAWFLRRSTQTLLDALALEDHTYIKLAVGILLGLDDDKHQSREGNKNHFFYDSKTRSWDQTWTIYPEYSEFPALFYLLNGNSKDFYLANSGTKWALDGGRNHRQQNTERLHREIPHSEKWDACPQAFIHLLVDAKADLVQNFALEKLKNHKNYQQLAARLDQQLLRNLLKKKHLPTALFALEWTEKMFAGQMPDRDLVLDMLDSAHEAVRLKGHQWMRDNLAAFVSDTNFVFRLLTHPVADIRTETERSMPEIVPLLTPVQLEILTGKIIGFLLGLEPDKALQESIENVLENTLDLHPRALELLAVTPGAKQTGNIHTDEKTTTFTQITVAAGVIDSLKSWAAPILSGLSFELIDLMLGHPVYPVAMFGAEMVTQKANLNPDLAPDETVNKLLRSKMKKLRQTGVELLEKSDLQSRLLRRGVLTKNLVNNYPDIRQSMRMLLGTVIENNPEFAQQMLGTCLHLLLRKEPLANVHEEIYGFILENLSAQLPDIERKTIFRLLNSEQIAANTLAAHLVQNFVTAESLSVRNIIRLGEHEVLAVREVCRQMFNENAARMRYESADAVKLLESEWNDTRDFAFAYFKKEFGQNDWTSELMVSICDSVKPAVQVYGKSLIDQYLNPEDGPDFLMQISQHPRPEMQAYATKFLETYAAGKPDMLENLAFYCTTVLCQVNKSRAARDMVFQFLEKEALESEKSAPIVNEILTNVSLTSVVEDKEKYIGLMNNLKKKYPQLSSPLKVTSERHEQVSS